MDAPTPCRASVTPLVEVQEHTFYLAGFDYQWWKERERERQRATERKSENRYLDDPPIPLPSVYGSMRRRQ